MDMLMRALALTVAIGVPGCATGLSNHTISALHAAVLLGAIVALSRAGKPRVQRPNALLTAAALAVNC
jgi:hypothetical protein